MTNDPEHLQVAFYIVSPIITFLAVSIAYLAIYRQSKPSVSLHYEPSNDVASVIDFVIRNNGGGSARDLEFSKPIPISCWGIEQPIKNEDTGFLKIKTPLLAPGKELRWQAGQYGGLLAQIGDGVPISVSYTYRSPLSIKKTGKDVSILDINYMSRMNSSNSPAYDLADAMKGRNNTIFLKTNKQLEEINKNLSKIAKALENNENSTKKET